MATPTNPAEDLLNSEFPAPYRPLVPAALKRAYASADQAYERLDWLSTPSGKFHRGDLILLATEFEFARLIREGRLPFEPVWEDYAVPTGKHLVMKSPGAHITINQVEWPHIKPRRAIFRDQLATPNTDYLFPEWNEERAVDERRKHIVLLHGHSELRFSTLAIPHPTENRLIEWTGNLLDIPHEVSSPAMPGEGPTESPDAEIIDEVLRAVRDNDD
jgi:hypothetical protein